ncbi:hypothetical protein EPA93_45270 [Ktedonosporobacter rubrisoli]|uniref:Uncharacterized protein n=1 Tax=Ktedonosporobacter rubrisoli TaxID=2509675 RepID=A0A4P6K3G3_KTERU|nr:hypothetical protein [Ktedonosporobacter rubrisoli]QBD82797.1 hypothetical protein EPA93_45270 [Ktedonosporobacter rubrisoli]
MARKFQQRIARIIRLPWFLAAASDARAVKGQRANPYAENLIKLLPRDQQALLTFLEVIHMLKPPLAFLQPLLVAKVVSSRWRRS